MMKLPRRLVLACAVAAVSLIGLASEARAHNALSSSEPADGAVLTEAPTQWMLTFSGKVPLESASAEIVLPDGTRKPLPGAVHGASENVIVFSLPPGLVGDITARWRLVGTDGHVISGRAQFTVEAPAPAETTVPIASDPSTSTSTTSVPATTSVPSTTSDPLGPETTEPQGVVEPLDDSGHSPFMAEPISEQIRWVVQILTYLGIFLFGGLLFADIVLARGILRRPRAVLSCQAGALVLFIVPVVSSLVHVADVAGVSLMSSFDHLGTLVDSTAGSMFLLRALIGFVMLMMSLSLDQRPTNRRFISQLVVLVSLYIVTMPFTGHSRSMRWPVLGVPADIVHLGGATIWLGGLAAVVFFIMPSAKTGNAVVAYIRFSRFAGPAVGAIVVTGLVQTLRLHGQSLSSFGSSHGVVLIVKVVLVLAMIGAGWMSRRYLAEQRGRDDSNLRTRLIQITALEAVLGLVVTGFSAALVRASFGG